MQYINHGRQVYPVSRLICLRSLCSPTIAQLQDQVPCSMQRNSDSPFVKGCLNDNSLNPADCLIDIGLHLEAALCAPHSCLFCCTRPLQLVLMAYIYINCKRQFCCTHKKRAQYSKLSISKQLLQNLLHGILNLDRKHSFFFHKLLSRRSHSVSNDIYIYIYKLTSLLRWLLHMSLCQISVCNVLFQAYSHSQFLLQLC